MYRSLASSIAAVIVTVSLTPGCAMAISGPDPHRALDEVPRCDTGKGPVMVDGLWAAVAGVAALVAFGDDEAGLGVAMIGVGGLFALSAAKGNRQANACATAFDDYNTLLAQRRETSQDAAARRARRRARPVPPPPVATVPDPVPPPVTPPPVAAAPAGPSTPPTSTSTPRTVPAPSAFTTPRPGTKRAPTAPRPEPARADADWSQFWKVVP